MNAKLFVALSQIAFLRLILSLLFGISCKPDTTCLNSQQCLPVVPKQQPVGKASRMWRDSEACVKLKTWARKQQKYVMHRRLIFSDHPHNLQQQHAVTQKLKTCPGCIPNRVFNHPAIRGNIEGSCQVYLS